MRLTIFIVLGLVSVVVAQGICRVDKNPTYIQYYHRVINDDEIYCKISEHADDEDILKRSVCLNTSTGHREIHIIRIYRQGSEYEVKFNCAAYQQRFTAIDRECEITCIYDYETLNDISDDFTTIDNCHTKCSPQNDNSSTTSHEEASNPGVTYQLTEDEVPSDVLASISL